jgi:hypothetical protein
VTRDIANGISKSSNNEETKTPTPKVKTYKWVEHLFSEMDKIPNTFYADKIRKKIN